MKFKNMVAAALLSAVLAAPVAFASSSHSSHKKNNRPKTVHVKSYKRKNGEVVKAHDRSTPRPQ